jgi:hypothetical protein
MKGITTFDQYKLYIKNNPLMLLGLEKNPTKQNIYEKEQIEYYNLCYNELLEKLPNGGINSKCIICNTINKKQIYTIDSCKAKCEIKTKTFDCIDSKGRYYILKHINDNGGAQDNQYNDVIYSLAMCVKYNNQYITKPISVVVILTGKYFNQDKLEKLNKYNDTNIKIKYID